MSSLPPVYIASVARTPVGSFLGLVSPMSTIVVVVIVIQEMADVSLLSLYVAPSPVSPLFSWVHTLSKVCLF